MYAAGARLIAVPGWPFPTFCTASAARTRTVSTARWSSSVHSRSVVVGLVLTLGQGSSPHVVMPVTVTPTGRCRAYPRRTRVFSSAIPGCRRLGRSLASRTERTRLTFWATPMSATATLRACPIERRPSRVRRFRARCRAAPTRPHPREGRGIANVYSGVVRASLHRAFTPGGLLGLSLSGVCVTAVESRPAGVARDEPSPGGHRPFGARVKAFVALTKPRIIELLLITTVPVMFLAAQGVPDLWLVLHDLRRRLSLRGRRQRAQHVHRPRHRRADGPHVAAPAGHRHGQPARVPGLRHRPRGRSPPSGSGCWSTGCRRRCRSVRSSSTSSSTRCCLKRRTAQNIVWGGIAGCMPVLIGWSAVTNSMSWAPSSSSSSSSSGRRRTTGRCR